MLTFILRIPLTNAASLVDPKVAKNHESMFQRLTNVPAIESI
jgi:hypothetical protein